MGQAPPLTVDQDPVRSPESAPVSTVGKPLSKQGKGYILKTNVEEVVLNATVLDGNRIVQNLKKDNFQVYEDGVKQKILSFQHTDLPVSMGLVIDNSGSMYKKRPAVNAAAVGLVQASNPDDQAFVVSSRSTLPTPHVLSWFIPLLFRSFVKLNGYRKKSRCCLTAD